MKLKCTFLLILSIATLPTFLLAQKKNYDYYIKQVKSAYKKKYTNEEVIAFLDTAIALKPHSSEAYEQRSDYKRRLNLKKESRQDLDSAIMYAKPSKAYHLYNDMASSLMNANTRNGDSGGMNDKDILAFYNKAIKLFPDSAEFYSNRAYFFQQRKKYKEAIADMQKTVKLKPIPFYYHSLVWDMEASDLYTVGEVLAVLNKCIEKNPKDVQSYKNRAYYYASRRYHLKYYNDTARIWRDCDTAIVDWDKVVEMAEKKGQYYKERAQFKQNALGRYSEAEIEKDYSKSFEFSNNKDDAYSEKSRYLAEKFRYEEAIAALDSAILLEKDDPNSSACYNYNTRAKLKRETGTYSTENILADYNKSIALRNDESDSYTDRAAFYRSKRMFKEAIKDMDTALTIPHNRLDYYFYKRLDYKRESGFYSDADLLKDYQTAIDKEIEGAERAYTKRANYYYETKRYKEAIADLDKLIAIRSNSKKLEIGKQDELKIGYLYHQRGQFKMESGLYSNADVEKDLKMAPRDTADFDIYMDYISKYYFYYKNKNYQEAIACMEEFYGLAKKEKGYPAIDRKALKGLLDLKKESGLYSSQYIVSSVDTIYKGVTTAKEKIEKANYLSVLGLYKEAVNEYAKLVSAGKFDTSINNFADELYTNKALAEIKIGEYANAIADASTVIKMTPSISEIFNLRGFAHYLSGNYDMAINDYYKAIALGKKNYQPLFEYKKEAFNALKTNNPAQIVCIEWMKPNYATNDIQNDTLKLDNISFWGVKYRVSSSTPLQKDNIKIWVNEQEAEEVKSFSGKRIVPQTIKQANGNTLYLYDFEEGIKLYDKTSVVNATYGDFSSPKVYVWLKKMPNLE